MLTKKWAAISPVSVTSDGSKYGEISVETTRHFRVRHRVVLTSATQPDLLLEIKRVNSSTSMILGHNGNLNSRSDLTRYLASDGCKIFAAEQDRPAITRDAQDRGCFEESPVVARRTILVDELGNLINSDNPLPTDATFENIAVEIAHPSKAEIQNINILNPMIETEITMPDNTSKFSVQVRDHQDTFRLAFEIGGTVNKYEKISRGNSFECLILNMADDFKIYVLTENKTNMVLEITAWKD